MPAPPIKMLERPCDLTGVLDDWPRLKKIMQSHEDSLVGDIATTSAGWQKGTSGASILNWPFVMTNLGKVYLPWHPARDPNIIPGQNILVRRIPGGLRIIDQECLDDKIGTSKSWDLALGDIPQGWAIQDGVANSEANGGTGINKLDSYCKWGDTAGTQDGTDSYTPSGTIDGSLSGTFNSSSESITISGTTDTHSFSGSESTDVTLNLADLQSDEFTVPLHEDHDHGWVTVGNVDNNGGGVTQGALLTHPGNPNNRVSAGADLDGIGQEHKEHQPTRAFFTESSAYETTVSIDKSAWDHDHTVTLTGGSHYHTVDLDASGFTFVGDEMIIDLPHTLTIPIERIDNSSG